MNEPLLTVDEVAFILSISTQTVRKLIQSHQLLAVKFGRNYRVSCDAINKFILEKQS